MLKKSVPYMIVALATAVFEPTASAGTLAAADYINIIAIESSYLAACQLPTGAIIAGPGQVLTFQGSPHYKICPYFSNFAANAQLDNPTASNTAMVKSWILWYFNHLNSDGSIDDYYADNFIDGIEHKSSEANAADNIPIYDSIDSYAATFLSLCRKYAQVTGNIAFLRDHSYQLELVGNALRSVVDDSNHYYAMFSPDNNDGLTVAKPDYQPKYTMDNSEVNAGLKDMIWLQQNVSTYNNPTYYQTLLDNNTNGMETHLWNGSNYYMYEGGPAINWQTFYADALCQLYPIIFGVIPPSSSRANSLYSTFNDNYPNWSTGTVYDQSGYPWAMTCYAAAILNDKTRVDAYLCYVQSKGATHPSQWYILESAATLHSAKMMLDRIPLTPPAAPTGLSATADNGRISLAWSASFGATGYNVYRGTIACGESTTPIAIGTSTAYTNTGLTNGIKYYYKVAAANPNGTSPMSSEVSATPASSLTPIAGTGYIWSGMSTATANTSRAAKTGINDGNLTTNTKLPTAVRINEYQAAGIIWTTAQTIRSAKFINGTTASGNTGYGFFEGSIQLQITTNGSTWTNSGWTVNPTYSYTIAVSGMTYTFSGPAIPNVKGARVIGLVNKKGSGDSAYLQVREVQIFD